MTTSLALAVVLAPYTVREVDRRVAFAGRLGQRVEITLRVEREGEVRSIRLARRHTRAGRIPEFQVGDKIVLPNGEEFVTPEQVRRVGP